VAIAREVIQPDGTTIREWAEFEGTGADVAKAIETNAPSSRRALG
jgi:hypothetical protein